MSEEKKFIKDDEVARETQALLERLPKMINPKDVLCMMGIVISKSPDNPTDENGNPMAAVQQFSIGSGEDIRRMMLLLIERSYEDDDKERIH